MLSPETGGKSPLEQLRARSHQEHFAKDPSLLHIMIKSKSANHVKSPTSHMSLTRHGAISPKNDTPKSILLETKNSKSIKCNVERFHKHNEMMQCLVKMTVSSDLVIGDFVDDIQCAFHLPTAANNNKYICKLVDYVHFNHSNEVIEFILNEFWDESFSQNVYKKLIKILTAPQKCKLMSIGSKTKTKKYRLKKYKHCFVGSDGVKWLIHSRLAKDIQSAMKLANKCLTRGLIKTITNGNGQQYKNDEHAIYAFNFDKIDNVLNLSPKPKIPPFTEHDKLIQNLISMCLCPATEIDILLDLAKAFYLPRTDSFEKHNKFICKLDQTLSFDNIVESLHYTLIKKWNEDYSQVVYRKLLSQSSIAQKAKLLSLGIKRKTRKKHFKRYEDCFVGSEACQWLVNKGFCTDYSEAIQLGNIFRSNEFIKNMMEKEGSFKNGNVFYQFNDTEISKQCITETYKNNKIASPQVYIANTPFPNGSSDESDNFLFPDIDYDVHSLENKIKSFEYAMSDENECKEDQQSDSNTLLKLLNDPSFPGICAFEQPRTSPIKIKKSRSRTPNSFYRSTPKKLLICPSASASDDSVTDLSNVAMHNGFTNGLPSIMSSKTAHTPEPHISICDDMPMDMPLFDIGKSMATRVSAQTITQQTQDEDTFIDFDIHDEMDGLDELADLETSMNTFHQKAAPSMASTSQSLSNDSKAFKTTNKHRHHILESSISSDFQMDNKSNSFHNFTQFSFISNHKRMSNHFQMNPFSSKQIGM